MMSPPRQVGIPTNSCYVGHIHSIGERGAGSYPHTCYKLPTEVFNSPEMKRNETEVEGLYCRPHLHRMCRSKIVVEEHSPHLVVGHQNDWIFLYKEDSIVYT